MNNLLDILVFSIAQYFYTLFVGGTTRKCNQRYYTLKRLIIYIYSMFQHFIHFAQCSQSILAYCMSNNNCRRVSMAREVDFRNPRKSIAEDFRYFFQTQILALNHQKALSSPLRWKLTTAFNVLDMMCGRRHRMKMRTYQRSQNVQNLLKSNIKIFSKSVNMTRK